MAVGIGGGDPPIILPTEKNKVCNINNIQPKSVYSNDAKIGSYGNFPVVLRPISPTTH